MQGNLHSEDPSISDDGRFVAFESKATNLVNGDRNGRTDVFVRDREHHRTILVSRSTASMTPQGGWDPMISGNGRFVAFVSEATKLVRGDTNGVMDVFVRDLRAGTTEGVSVSSGENQYWLS